jgi:hypothetical protein
MSVVMVVPVPVPMTVVVMVTVSMTVSMPVSTMPLPGNRCGGEHHGGGDCDDEANFSKH